MFALITQSNDNTSMNAALGNNSWVSRKNLNHKVQTQYIKKKIKNRKQQVEWSRNVCLPQANQLRQILGFVVEERVTYSRLSFRGDGRRTQGWKKRERNKTSEGVLPLHSSYCSTFSRARPNTGIKSFSFFCWTLCIVGQKVSTKSWMTAISLSPFREYCYYLVLSSNTRLKGDKMKRENNATRLPLKTWCSLSAPQCAASNKGNWNSWCLYWPGTARRLRKVVRRALYW